MGKQSRRPKRRREGTGVLERPATPRPPVAPRPSPDAGAHDQLILVAVFLALVVATFYLPALDGGFINWDDPDYVTLNPNIRSLSWKTVTWAFTSFTAGNWHPLTSLSLAVDYRLYGLHPYGYHLTSLILHVANSVLLLLVLHRMTGALWRSAVVAALFGVHPLHVESVAWVSERKDVLCAFFWLLAMATYVRWVRGRRWSAYAVLALTFALALLSKPMAITLPLALLLLDWWPFDRLSWAAVVEKVPLLLLAGGESVATFVAQKAEGAVLIDPVPFSARLANAIVAYARYLGLTLWPLHLSPWYSHPAVEGPPRSPLALPAALGLLIGITALALVLARRQPWVTVGWLWYLGTLVPVIGVVQVGRQAMADRYTYIPHIGIFVAIVWSVAAIPRGDGRGVRAAAAATVGALVLVLGVLTFRQTRIWRDATTFWTYTARTNPYAFIAHQALGGILSQEGRLDEALREFRQARRLRPDIAVVHKNVGSVLARQGRFAAAAAEYRKAVALRASADDENALGGVLLRQRRPLRARRHFERAVAIRPGFAEAHANLGRALLASGLADEAAAEFRVALEIKPGLVDARRGLDEALARRARAAG